MICPICHTPFKRGRRDQEVCSPPCRAERSRLLAAGIEHFAALCAAGAALSAKLASRRSQALQAFNSAQRRTGARSEAATAAGRDPAPP